MRALPLFYRRVARYSEAMTSAHTPEPPSGGDTVSFGFKVVPEGARQGLVNEVFTTVAGRYDLMNDLMSGGLHRLWKDDLIGTLAPPRSDRPFHLLDVAGGTGDITLKALRAGGAGSSVTLLDINPEMVEVGAKRVADAGLSDRVTFVIGNAETLPFPDKTFDAYTIAFGIRNVTHIDKALAEAWRVLKTGGRFLALEFSACEVPLLDRLYELPLLRDHPPSRHPRRRRRRALSLPGREHPQVPQAGPLRRDDPRCRLLPCLVPQPHRRDCGDPFGVADLSAGMRTRAREEMHDMIVRRLWGLIEARRQCRSRTRT